MIYSRESLLVIKDEMATLLDNHYEELTLNKHVVKLNPDWERYAKLEAEGKLHWFCCRDGDGKLVGYSGFFLDTHIHYKDLVVATNDVYYMDSQYRKGVAWFKLLRYSEQQMFSLGAHKVVWHLKDSYDFSPILLKNGYKKEDSLYAKLRSS